MFDNLILIPLISGPIFMIAGYLLLKKPPKRINTLYGYRTSNSMKSQERWDFAQNYSAKELMNLGFFLFLTSFIGKFVEMDSNTKLIAGLAMILAMVVVLFFRVERAIKEEFKYK